MISRAQFTTRKVVHYAVIFTFWSSRKRFYHYTERINTPVSAGALPPAPHWGHSPQNPLAASPLERSSGSATANKLNVHVSLSVSIESVYVSTESGFDLA